MNANQFNELLGLLLDANNDNRKKGETALNTLREQDPNTFVILSLGAVRDMNLPAARRQLSCTLLRPALIKEYKDEANPSAAVTFFWDKLTPQVQAGVTAELLKALESETDRTVLRKLYDMVSDVCSFLDGRNITWGDLFSTLFRMTGSESDILREGAFEVFSQLPLLIGIEKFRPNLETIRGLLVRGLTDPKSFNVRLSALGAVSAFLQMMEEEEDKAQLNGFRACIQPMLDCCTVALQNGKEEEANKALELFIELAGAQANFFRPALKEISGTMLAIAGAQEAPEDTAQLAMEMLISLCENLPVAMKKVEGFVPGVLNVLLTWMTTVEDVDDWEDFADSDNYSNSDAAEESLDRLCNSLHGKVIVKELFARLGVLLRSDVWKNKHAGLMATAICGEGCGKSLKVHIEELLKSVIPLTCDAHQRIRWAAINCVGQMCQDFGPTLQRKYGKDITAAIVRGMGDACPRVAAHAASCIVNFVDTGGEDAAVTYGPQFLEGLRALCGSQKLKVQEIVTEALSNLVSAMGTAFTPYYDAFVPYLKSVISQAKEKDHRLLRGRAMETLSIIGVSVGKERFSGDALEVMREIMATQTIDADDPQIMYVESALGTFATLMGSEFEQFLPTVIPSALQRAGQELEIRVADANGEEREGWEVVRLGESNIEIHTSQLDDKASALEALRTYADSTGAAFLPYVEKVLEIAIKNAKTIYGEVRVMAYLVFPSLVKVVVAAVRAGKAPADVLRKLIDMILSHITKVLPEEEEIDVRVAGLNAITDSLKEVGETCLDEHQMNIVAEMLKTMLNMWIAQRAKDNKTKSEVVEDEETNDDIEEIKLTESEALASMTDCIDAVFLCQKDAFAPAYKQFLQPICTQLVDPKRDADVIARAICVADTIIEKAPALAVENAEFFIKLFLNYADSKQPDVRQAAVYGLGLAGSKYPQATFAPYLPQTLQKLHAIVTSPNAFTDEDFCVANDNAVASVGRLIEALGTALPSFDEVLRVFMASLPLQNDEEESAATIRMLCSLVKRFPEKVLGATLEKAPAVVKIFAVAAQDGLINKEDVPEIKSIVLELSSKVNPSVLASGLTQENQTALQDLIK